MQSSSKPRPHRQLALERNAAHLAVGDDLEACLFLEPHGFIHGPILDVFEVDGGDVTCGVVPAGNLQLR